MSDTDGSGTNGDEPTASNAGAFGNHTNEPLPDGGNVGGLETDNSDPTVLIADDEKLLANAYSQWLDDTYTTRIAYDGTDAMALLDESVDIAVLDRTMPGHSGEEVAQEIHRQGFDCCTALISAHKPDLDLLEVEYDAYRVKPITDPDDLLDLLDTLRRRATYNPEVRRLLALAAKKTTIETHVSQSALEESPGYTTLLEELADLQSRLSDTTELLTDEGFRPTF